MGKASRWFRALLNLKRPDSNPTSKQPKDNKRRWSFAKSYRQNSSSNSRPRSNISYDASSTSSAHVDYVPTTCMYGGSYEGERQVWAALVLQSCFRGYLARRALRALKGLVKLQAVVRGDIMRRRTAETLRCMQAMLRAQARARYLRAYVPESPHSSSKSSQLHQPGPPTPEKFEQFVRAKGAKHSEQPPRTKGNSSSSSGRMSTTNQHKMNLGSSRPEPRMKTDENRAGKILERDIGMPHLNPRRQNLFDSSHSRFQTSEHVSNSYTTTSKESNLKFSEDTENSTQYNSATSRGDSSRKGPFTSTKSDGSRSFLSGYSDCPSYMAYTESSRAKVRSVSAPKSRTRTDRSSSSTKRSYSVHGLGDPNPRSNAKRMSDMQARFTSKAHLGPGRLVRDSTVIYYSGYLNE